MEVGDLVRYRDDGDIGLVTEVDCYGRMYILWSSDFEGWHIAKSENRPSHYTPNSSYIHWGDGDRGWFENIALEVICK